MAAHYDAMGMSRSPDDIGSLEETLAVLSDPVAMKQISESEKSLAGGERITALADLQAQLRAGGPGLEPG